MDYKFPKFRENIWRFVEDGKKTYLVTSDEAFEVKLEDATTFLKIRPYCTGHNSVEEIALKSNISLKKVKDIIDSLYNMGLGYPSTNSPESDEQLNTKFINLCKIWADELKNNFIGNKLMEGQLPKQVLIGWLIEMYHYISDFPHAIDVGVEYAEGELKTRY